MMSHILKRTKDKQRKSYVSVCKRKNSTQPDPEFIFMPRLESQLPDIPSRTRSAQPKRRPHIPCLLWNDGLENKKVVVKESQCSEGKKKCDEVNENKEESEGESVNYVNGEKVDFISFITREGHGACEKVLENMTKCMTREERLGFMESLEGEWLGARKRRKVVSAAIFVNFFPIDWKIVISIRRRVDLITFYCRKYVSPAGLEFETCTEAASYLRAQSLIDVAGSSKEVEMGQINNGSRMLLKSINETASSSHHEATNNLPGTNDLYDVTIASFIDCYPCGLKFEDMGGLEKHLASFHKKTTRRLNLPTREATRLHTLESLDPQKDPCQHAVMDRDEPQLDQARSQQNGQASSIPQTIAEAQEPVTIVNANGRFLTTCTWCYKEFLCGPVDAETMAEAAGYMCPKCKKKACGVFETLNGV